MRDSDADAEGYDRNLIAKNYQEQDAVDPIAVLRDQQHEMLIEVQDDIDELGEEFQND